jgi:hypothetical protein
MLHRLRIYCYDFQWCLYYRVNLITLVSTVDKMLPIGYVGTVFYIQNVPGGNVKTSSFDPWGNSK